MKKLLVILSMVLISSSLMAQSNNYVKTDAGTNFFKKIKVDKAHNLVGIKLNGERIKYTREEIQAFVQNGDYYERMPVYENNTPTGEEDLMKVVENRDGMILLEYKHLSKATGQKITKYYVFKGEKYVVEMDNNNEETLTAFFDTY